MYVIGTWCAVNPSAHCEYVFLSLLNKKLTGWWLDRKLGRKTQLRWSQRETPGVAERTGHTV